MSDILALHKSRNIAGIVQCIQNEILELIAEGRIPSSVQSFSDLHDFVDANELGGFCEDDIFDFYFDEQEGLDCSVANLCSDQVDEWLKQGRQGE